MNIQLIKIDISNMKPHIYSWDKVCHVKHVIPVGNPCRLQVEYKINTIAADAKTNK